jgi:hypothetical protein
MIKAEKCPKSAQVKKALKGVAMQTNRNRSRIAFLVLVTMLTFAVISVGQDDKSLVASANGQGTIKLGKEEFKVYAVVVKLFEDNKAEINIVSDISIFVNGTWSRGSDADKSIDLKISGGSVNGNLDGGGKLLLKDDRKAIAGLNLQILNKGTKKLIKVDFVAK